MIVPQKAVRFQVTSGSFVGTPTLIGNDCLLPSGTYYNVTVNDSNGNLLFTDKWLIQGSSQDVGTIVSVVITGTTQTLGSIGVVLTQPSGAQTIAQPSNTNFSVNNFCVGSACPSSGSTSNLFTLPDTSYCTTAGCWFNTTPSFLQGINTGTSQPSNIWIGNTISGNFYNRTFSVSDAPCSGVADGWMGVRIDVTPKQLEVCVGNALYKAALN